MSYRTVEVEIDRGHVLAKGAESLPEKVSGLLTILNRMRQTTLPSPRYRPWNHSRNISALMQPRRRNGWASVGEAKR
jgi:hypothetical protein